jgi:hypothetical protein
MPPRRRRRPASSVRFVNLTGREHDLGVAVPQRHGGLASAVVAPEQAMTELTDVELEPRIEVRHWNGDGVNLAQQGCVHAANPRDFL